MKKKTLSLPSKLSRQFTATARAIEGGDGSAPVRYAMSVSSEQPYLRYGFGLDNGWYEVLSHAPGAIDMSRADGMPLLLQHDHAAQVGVVEAIALNDSRQLAAEVRFSRSARGAEIEQDVSDGIRRNVSIGYQILQIEHTGTAEDGLPILTATRWMPFEVSSVSVPADHTVGVSRAAQDDDTQLEVELPGEDDEDEATNAKKRAEGDEEEQQPAADGPADGDAPANPDSEDEAQRAAGDEDEQPEGDAAMSAAPGGEGSTEGDAAPASPEDEDAEKERQREVTRMATSAGHAARAADFITRGLTPAQAGKELLALRRSIPTVSKPTLKKDSPKMNYSLARAIQVALGLERGGVEADVDARIQSGLPDTYQRHGKHSIFVAVSNAQLRALNTQAPAEGGATVFEQEGEFIDMLRNTSLAFRLGARAYTNLRGPVKFPKLAGGVSAKWVAENSGVDVDASEPLFTTVSLHPKSLMAHTAFSRQLLAQSALDIESIIKTELAEAHALEIDRTVFNGKGGQEPVGIYNAAGVPSVSLADGVSYGKVIDMVAEAAVGNALVDNQAFVTTPRVAGRCAQTLVAPAAGAGFLWNGKLSNGEMAGYTAACSNQLPSDLGAANDEHGFVFGNFGDVLVGSWGVMELVVDEFTLARQGLIAITSFQMADVALRHPESFVKGTGLKLAA